MRKQAVSDLRTLKAELTKKKINTTLQSQLGMFNFLKNFKYLNKYLIHIKLLFSVVMFYINHKVYVSKNEVKRFLHFSGGYYKVSQEILAVTES
jgi:hypothetical protein